MIYSVSIGIVLETVDIVTKNVISASKWQTEIEDFTDTVNYISRETRGKGSVVLEHPTWSVLALDTKPIVAYQIISGDGQYKLRRLVAEGKIDLETLKKGPGLLYFNTNFAGFNTVYFGDKRLYFTQEDGYAVLQYDDKKVFLSVIED